MLKGFAQTIGRFFRSYAHVVVALLVLVGVLWYFGAQQTVAAWYSGGGGTWDHRIKVTINSSEVSSDLTDFPVYVDLADLPANFHTNVRSDGGDIRVAAADGETEIPRELVSYDASADSGELHFKAPSISATTDTDFYIYYGNGSATDYATNATYGAENVWTNGFVGVWNLASTTDSTSSSHDGTTIGGPAVGGVDGKIGKATHFDGTDDQIDLVGPHKLTDTAWTVAAWVKSDTFSDWQNIIGSSQPNGSYLRPGGYISVDVDGKLSDYDGSWIVSTSALVLDTWHYVVFQHSNAQVYKMYVDGALDLTKDPSTAQNHPDGEYYIDRIATFGSGVGRYFDGIIDDIRVSNVIRSTDWITAEHANQNTPTTFYTVGSEETLTAPTVTTQAVSSISTSTATANGEITATGGENADERGFVYATSTQADPGNTVPGSSGYTNSMSETGSFGTGTFSQSLSGLDPDTTYYVRAYAHNSAGYSYGGEQSFTTNAESVDSPWYDANWQYRIKITIQASQVSSSLTDFPVYVDLSNLPADFHTNVRNDGGDIRMTTGDAKTEIPREVVSYNDATDTGEIHFKAPSLSATADTVFYIYYGNGAATDYATNATFGAENVWTNGYVGLWHMQEDPSGTTPQVMDSTAKNNDGASGGAMTSSDLVSGKLGNAIDFDGGDDYVEMPDAASLGIETGAWGLWVNADSWQDNGGGRAYWFDGRDHQYMIFSDSSTSMSVFVNVGGFKSLTTTPPSVGEWHYIAATFDGSYLRVYIDGQEVPESPAAISGVISTSAGNTRIGNYIGGGYTADGRIDKVFTSNTPPSSGWISAEYTNINTPTSFYVVGSQETKSSRDPESGSGDSVIEIRGGEIRGGVEFR